jgi:hypothetical protein
MATGAPSSRPAPSLRTPDRAAVLAEEGAGCGVGDRIIVAVLPTAAQAGVGDRV